MEPVYNEVFTYSGVSATGLESKQLEVSVVDRKGRFSRRALMGRVVVDLSGGRFTQGTPTWFQLEEAEDLSD